ncbi:MAG: PAS domain-containing protein [Elusimicrobiales bacterium]|jgi:PAS domain S-box-containing protein
MTEEKGPWLPEQDALAVLFEHLPVGVAITDARGTELLLANPAAARILNGPEAAPLKDLSLLRSARRRGTGTVYPEAETPLSLALASGLPAKAADLEIARADGSYALLDMTAAPIKGSGGETAGVLMIFSDSTDIFRRKSDIRSNPEFIEALLSTLPVPVFHKDLAGRYTGFNSAFLKFTGRDAQYFMGKTVFETAPREIAEKYKQKDDELLASGALQIYEWKVKRYDGDIRDVVFHKTVLKDAAGLTYGLIGTILDITDRKRAEDMLKLSEEKLSATLSSLDDLVFVFDGEGILREFYQTSHPHRILGGGASIGRHYSAILPEQAVKLMDSAQTRLRETMKPQDFDFRVPLPDGEVWYNARLSAHNGPAGNFSGITAVCRDISDRKKLELAAREIQDLQGLIPICASCKKIRTDQGYWQQVETYIEKRSSARFSHGLCKDCEKKLYGSEAWYGRKKSTDG